MEKVQVSPKQTLSQGKQMLVMGISMSFSGILVSVVSYVTRGFIQGNGGIDQVGLYQAGFVIMTTYVGLVMNAISTDYYPRLAAINQDNIRCREAINQQGEIGTLILAPMLSVCLVFMPFILQFLYSEHFLTANEYISWACVGMMFRLSSWIISFLFVAKAESKLFIFNELAISSCSLILNIICYKLGGLQGLGFAFAFKYFIYFLQVYFIARHRYEFRFSKSFIMCYGTQLLLVLLCFTIVQVFEGGLKYILGSVIIVISSYLSLKGLNQRINLTDILKNKIMNK